MAAESQAVFDMAPKVVKAAVEASIHVLDACRMTSQSIAKTTATQKHSFLHVVGLETYSPW